MNQGKWKFRKDILRQYINSSSAETFQDAQDRLNELEEKVEQIKFILQSIKSKQKDMNESLDILYDILQEHPQEYVYAAVYNYYDSYHNLIEEISESPMVKNEKFTVSLIYGDTLRFQGLNSEKISNLLESFNCDYQLSDSPEDVWETEIENKEIEDIDL